MARNCPHCGELIDYLKYNARTHGWETGTVSDGGNWDSDDSGTDDTMDYTYYCPECDHEIRHGSDWIQEEEDPVEGDNIDFGGDTPQQVVSNTWSELL